MSLFVLAATLLLGTNPSSTSSLICCGGEEVFVLRVNAKEPKMSDRTWRWRATDSPEIPDGAHSWFRSTDECKPLQDSILITSSSGGVALVRRSDKSCLFYTHARNAHSACMLPDNRIAVASSFGGDELLLYDVGDSTKQAKPVANISLRGAHGAVWDSDRDRLWALGSDELLLVEIRKNGNRVKLLKRKSWKLPSPGGHDLAQMRDQHRLYVTTNEHVYQFDKRQGQFSLDRTLGNHKKVKSVTPHPITGEVVYHQATDRNWWSDTIRFVGDRGNLRLTNERLYKVRWDVAPLRASAAQHP